MECWPVGAGADFRDAKVVKVMVKVTRTWEREVDIALGLLNEQSGNPKVGGRAFKVGDRTFMVNFSLDKEDARLRSGVGSREALANEALAQAWASISGLQAQVEGMDCNMERRARQHQEETRKMKESLEEEVRKRNEEVKEAVEKALREERDSRAAEMREQCKAAFAEAAPMLIQAAVAQLQLQAQPAERMRKELPEVVTLEEEEEVRTPAVLCKRRRTVQWSDDVRGGTRRGGDHRGRRAARG